MSAPAGMLVFLIALWATLATYRDIASAARRAQPRRWRVVYRMNGKHEEYLRNPYV